MIKKQFLHEEDYLSSLNMLSGVNQFDNYSIPRIAQLTQRSNQFNLRTIRYTEEDIQRIACSNDYLTLSFTLSDNFGEYGLVSAVILKKQRGNLFIDTWIMSCRVLKRGMENFVLNQMIKLANEYGFENLIGEFIPTAKNTIVKEHYLNLGFNKISDTPDLYLLNVNEYTMSKTYITKHINQR
jgi:FkbH-like protein